MIDMINFKTDKGWAVESIGGIMVITFPEGKFEKVGNVQQFTFHESVDLEPQLVIENQVNELIRKLETFKVGV